MFFCPNCNNSFDISKNIPIQTGGFKYDEGEEIYETPSSETISSSQTGGDQNEELIQKILNNQPLSEEEIKDVSVKNITQTDVFKRLMPKFREYIYNKIQDLLPNEKKKIIHAKEQAPLGENPAFFLCNNCGYNKKINPGTLIFSRSSESISQRYSTTDYTNMLHSDILPRTRRYRCPNEDCISHKDPEKKEAIFFRMNNSYRVKYICVACGTDF